MGKMPERLKIGVVKGAGSGPFLSDVFVMAIEEIHRMTGKEHLMPEIIFFPRKGCVPSYISSKRDIKLPSLITERTKEWADALYRFYVDFYSKGGRYIFKTAINAEILYQLRVRGKAIKEIPVSLPQVGKLIIIRDETQGFYGITEYKAKYESEKKKHIRYIEHFDFENFENIFGYIASKYKIAQKVIAIYKFHLFSSYLEQMIKEAAAIYDIDVEVFQPDSGLDALLRNSGNLDSTSIVLVGNEVGDVIFELLLYFFNMGHRYSTFTKNVYLDPNIKGLVEYQTVHGSADDVEIDTLNPLATLRASVSMIAEIYNDASLLEFLEKVEIIETDSSRRMVEEFFHALAKELNKRNDRT